MRIVHIDLTGPFTVGMNYQENIISKINAEDGHEVYFIAPNYVWENNIICKVDAGSEITQDNVHLIRMAYKKILFPILTEKLRMVKGLKQLLERIEPEIIMLHGYQTISVISLISYLKCHRHVKLFVDTHADALNSAQNIFSKVFLHKIIYTRMGKSVLKHTDKIWCITSDVMRFSNQMNKIPVNRLEYYPLGGKVFETSEYEKNRKEIREKYHILSDDILLMHSGKMDIKKKTIDILKAFQQVNSSKIKIIIVGKMDTEVRKEYEKYSEKDDRIFYIGWKSGEDLLKFLCAADLYIQPGTQSATMQNAACCACALALYPYDSHKFLFQNTVFYIENDNDIVHMLTNIVNNPQVLVEKKNASYVIAKEKLDYKKLAKKIYSI